jgi:CDGSH-type Zn-finger protein/uncharacterized Fe-S cluster protein YjdI
MASRVLRYEGADIVVKYDVDRCIHAAECAEGLPEVFDPERRPWVDPEAARPGRIAAVIHRCPSGALTYERFDGEPDEPVPEENLVVVDEDGPFFVTGNIEIRDPDGSLLSKETRVALCRCGLSSNKPFCDNSHKEGGFVDEGRLGEGGVKLTPGLTDNVLTVTPSRNGPLLLTGEVRIEGSDGEERHGTRTALCRCGHSHNKPFCTGTHRSVDFVS